MKLTRKIMRAACTLVLLSAAATHQVAGQHMFDYSQIKAGKFTQKSVHGLRPMNDGEHYTVLQQGRIVKYSYKTGQEVATIFDVKDQSLMEYGEFPVSGYEFSANEDKILISTTKHPIYRHSYIASHWVYDIKGKKLYKLSHYGAEQIPAFSADGTMVAFVKDNNLWYANTDSGSGTDGFSVTPITIDGLNNEIINGHTDWVYEEEFGFTRAFRFSPDGKKIAYLRFDEREVREFTFMKYGMKDYPEQYTYKYPRAGETNSVVELFVYDFDTKEKVRIETDLFTGADGSTESKTDYYIPRFGWTPDGKLYVLRTNRNQNHLEVLLADAQGGTRRIYDEKDRRYIERPDDQTVMFLPKGDRFIVKNETAGNTHLYLYNVDKGVTDTLTRGNWDVTDIVEITSDRVYYISTEGSPLRRNLYSVKLNGKGKTRITQEDGTYRISPSKGMKYFISYFSNTTTPNTVRLHDNSGKVIRVLEDNEQLKKHTDALRMPKKEFFRFTTERGTVLNGYMIKPRDFSPDKKYPVLMTQYSGPGSQQVLDRWTVDWTDVLVQEGYIVVCIDGRGTGGRGSDFKKCTYGNLGGPETQDQISAAKYIATQPYVDMSRIGIYGWSYGGFMALNCILKGSDVFKMAIAVAPVTSWRFYDTIYTETYNGLPQTNAHGYDNNSPINFADQLKGKLLIVHGTADDNVHVQNSYAMAEALVKAGKQFDMMIYPDDNHSMMPGGRHNVMEKMIGYTLNNL